MGQYHGCELGEVVNTALLRVASPSWDLVLKGIHTVGRSIQLHITQYQCSYGLRRRLLLRILMAPIFPSPKPFTRQLCKVVPPEVAPHSFDP